MQNIVEGFHLSPQQKRVWWLQPHSSPAYRSQFALHIEGYLQPSMLSDAFRKIIGQHEILRTTFLRQPDLKFPLQVINDECAPGLRQVDLGDCPAQEQDSRIADILRQERERPSELCDGLPLQSCLLKFTDANHVLVVTLPSMCADTQSLKNLINELVYELSAPTVRGEESSEEPLQYADFSQWQNELLEGEGAQAGSEFWASQRRSVAVDFKLPCEDRLPSTDGFKPEQLKLAIDPAVIAQLWEILPQYETSLADFMRATWQSLLWLLTKQSDLLVGDLCQGYRELETAVGLFAKFLPVQSHFEANSRFSEILKESAEATRRASEWREYFTWDYRAEAGAGVAGNSFFTAAFEFNEWAALASTDELKFSLHSQFVCFDRFKVKLCCAAKDSEVVAEFHYDSSLISERAMGLLAEQFTTLLNSAIRHPEALLSELEALSSKERQQLLVELNDTARAYPTDRCIHELFEAQAARTPDSLAVVYENDSLSYAELNTRANQVAHYLKRLGTKPETTVALCMERSVEMIVGMLGILKAGGVYVPLEPSQPVERLGYMLEDVRPLAVLTQQRLLEGFPAHTAPVLCLDADRDELARESGDNPPGVAAPGNLAYIIFTSGSTGRPKGVLVEHRQLVNYVHAIEERLSLSPGESYATVSTFAADLGHTCIFPSLSFAGCLHIISQERASDPSALSEYFTRQPVDVLKIVPSHLEALLASPAPEKVLPRRRLVLGGESSRWELIETVRQLAPGCEIFNHYGPTETTVGTITFHVEESCIGEHAANIPLGRPIANAEIYLLDGELRPVVTGMLGELYIGGAGVARGYLSHPGMTAEKFVPNPFATQPGARLYRTGDLARYRPGGDIEFAGRADNQIKFHGYRVELNEIRHTLNRHPDVKDSVVVMLDDGNGLDVLVAYYISRRELEVGMLREFLSASILKETLPGIFVHLKKMPLTLNGKINLAGLPTLEEVRQQAKQTFVAPRTPVEKLVADIWAEILRVEQVSIHDNFFEIGGHSLLATRVTTRLRDAFQIELPLRTIFEEPTVAMQATLITQMQVDQTDDEELMQLLSEIAQLPDEALDTIHQE